MNGFDHECNSDAMNESTANETERSMIDNSAVVEHVRSSSSSVGRSTAEQLESMFSKRRTKMESAVFLVNVGNVLRSH